MVDTEAGAAPSWVVTYGDMMSLLLTFFIMLMTFSEMRSEEKYQALVEGFQEKFGQNEAVSEIREGELRPRNSSLSLLSTRARTRYRTFVSPSPKASVQQGLTSELPDPAADFRAALQTVLYFQQGQVELDDSQSSQLRQQAELARTTGKPIEVRGIADYAPPHSPDTPVNWDLSFERCRRVMEYLTHHAKVAPGQLRVVLDSSEPNRLDGRLVISVVEAEGTQGHYTVERTERTKGVHQGGMSERTARTAGGKFQIAGPSARF